MKIKNQERDFENIDKYKPITESNRQLIDQIEKKNDEMVEDIVNSLPYYNENKTRSITSCY